MTSIWMSSIAPSVIKMPRKYPNGLIKERRNAHCPMFGKTVWLESKCLAGCKNFMGEVYMEDGIFIKCKARMELNEIDKGG